MSRTNAMELIMISDSKLKIMLTNEDMKAYAIDCSTLDYENTETRRAFWSILDEAKHRTGFDAASEKVFVQVYPSKEGGCEMYITKLGILSDKKSVTDDARDCGDEDLKIKNNPTGKTSGKEVSEAKYTSFQSRSIKRDTEIVGFRAYKFASMDLLLRACRQLSLLGYDGESRAYSSDEGSSYFLIISEQLGDFFVLSSRYGFICEYAERIDYEYADAYLGEHGRVICEEGAVSKLGQL